MSDLEGLLSDTSDEEEVPPRRRQRRISPSEDAETSPSDEPPPANVVDDGMSNPFIASLPAKPDRLTTKNDLRGQVDISKGTKKSIAVRRCKEANDRIRHLEALLKRVHNTATETFNVATAQFREGSKLLNGLRREVSGAKAINSKVTAERDKLLLDRRRSRRTARPRRRRSGRSSIRISRQASRKQKTPSLTLIRN